MRLRSLWAAPVSSAATQHAAVQHNAVNFQSWWQKNKNAMKVSEKFLILYLFNIASDGSQNLMAVIIVSSALAACFYFQPV